MNIEPPSRFFAHVFSLKTINFFFKLYSKTFVYNNLGRMSNNGLKYISLFRGKINIEINDSPLE